jgi:hypothetical protein
MVRSILGGCIAFTLVVIASASALAETPREQCQRMMTGAARADALAACDEAARIGGSAEDLSAAAIVRVTRSESPTTDDLIRAELLATAATRIAPGESWGYLAELAIARRWGDPAVIRHRLAELERVAPDDPKTLRARAVVHAPVPIGVFIGWGVLGLACVLTLTHAVWRWWRGRARGPSRVAALAAVSLALCAPQLAHADRFPIDDDDPERTVPTPAQADARPLDFAEYLQEMSGRAETRVARGDHAAAVRFLRALARAVPDAAIPRSKLCKSLVALGEETAALAACRDALGRSGARAEDFMRFGDLVLGKRSATPSELADVEAAALQLVDNADTRVLGWQLQCRLGVRLESTRLLEECTTGLAAARPADATTHVYLWSLALQRGEIENARRYIEDARIAGAGDEAIARMIATTPTEPRASWRLLLAAGLAFGLVGVGCLVVWVRRGRATAAVNG